MKRSALVLFLFGFLTVFQLVLANDGIDRYEGYYPSVFYHLYAPISGQAGFTVLEEDMKGGADAAPAFRWARQFALSITKIIAYETCREIGVSEHPMALFDFSAENGDTPIRWVVDKPARGRHPGGSHDGGVNLDFGYYMTGYTGTHMDPDYSVCDEHYSDTELDEDGAPKDLHQCIGPANRLDVPRQAYFFLRLFTMHRDEFHSLLLEQIGVDFYVKKAILDQITAWKNEGVYSISDELVREMQSIFTCDRWGGWARYHHHHCHIRFRNLDESGPHRTAIEDLTERVRDIEYELLRSESPGQSVFMKADLLSYKLSRAIDVTLLTSESEDIQQCRYRLGDADWVTADEPENNFRYVFDLPYGPTMKDTHVVVSAEIAMADGASSVISTSVYLPQQDPLLKIRINRDAISGDYSIERDGDDSIWTLWTSFPSVYSHCITGVDYYIFPWDSLQEPTIVAGEGQNFQAHCVGIDSDVLCVEAEVAVSTRIKYAVPIFVGTPSGLK